MAGIVKNEEIMGKSIACLDEHKKAHHCSEDGWRVFSNLLKTEYEEYYEMYSNLPEEYQKVVWGNVALRHLNHTYNPDENCVTINREQEHENYNLAVKKLETGKLEYPSISAVCEDENEKNLVLYGDGTSFSVGIIDTMNESALCYNNGSGDTGITELGGVISVLHKKQRSHHIHIRNIFRIKPGGIYIVVNTFFKLHGR